MPRRAAIRLRQRSASREIEWTPKKMARPRMSLFMLELQDDLAHEAAGFHELERVFVSLERKHALDDRLELMRRDEPAHREIVLARAHVDAERAGALHDEVGGRDLA